RRLSWTYVIKQSDQELALSCQQKIQKISQNYQALIKNIKSQEAIYSKIWQEFKQSAQQLTEIENQQKQIEDGFDGLQQGRNIGIDNLQQITQDLRQLKHQVEVLRLQGLPQDYRDNYYMVNTEAAQLAELLESIP
ncbi:hypothetical protein EQ500_15335, partial [Lactobacillus sp. XV13L]|nr:hypothetical protein [Lactobacillus sp. XV13L]